MTTPDEREALIARNRTRTTANIEELQRWLDETTDALAAPQPDFLAPRTGRMDLHDELDKTFPLFNDFEAAMRPILNGALQPKGDQIIEIDENGKVTFLQPDAVELLREADSIMAAWSNGCCPEGIDLDKPCPTCPVKCNVYSKWTAAVQEFVMAPYTPQPDAVTEAPKFDPDLPGDD